MTNNEPQTRRSIKIDEIAQKLIREQRDNARAFILDAVCDNRQSLESLRFIDSGTLAEFAEDFDFTNESYFHELDYLAHFVKNA